MNWTAFIDHLPALPEAIVLVGASALMIFDLYVKDARRAATLWFAQAILLLCAAATLFVIWGSGGARLLIFSGLFVADLMGHLLKLVCYLAVSAALVYSRQYLLERGLLRGEFVTLLLFALLGMMVMISAASFLSVFLGLELMSLCLYALVALNRDSALSTEAAMKYFVLGALPARSTSTRSRSMPGGSRPRRRTAPSSSSAWCSWSRGSPSRSASSPSTCGSPTYTTARPPR
jgi:NADH-quinone oxidoreductase subunit N